MAQIWGHALKLEKVGRHGDFFAPGGHSLPVMKVGSLLKQADIDMTVVDLFKRSTLFVSATEAPHRRSSEEPLSGLPKSALVKKLHEFNSAPVEALQNDELLDLMLPTARADFELCETYEYHPETPLECPRTIYGGLEDHKVEAERLAAWSEMTVGTSEIRMFPGGHFYLNSSRATFLQTFAGDLLRLRQQN